MLYPTRVAVVGMLNVAELIVQVSTPRQNPKLLKLVEL